MGSGSNQNNMVLYEIIKLLTMIVFFFKGVRKELKIRPAIHAKNSDYFHNLIGN